MPLLTGRHVCKKKSTPLNCSQPLHYACHHFFSEMLEMRYCVNYYNVNMRFVEDRKLKLQIFYDSYAFCLYQFCKIIYRFWEIQK